MTSNDETELLTVLYAGLLEASPWSTFLARLLRRTMADYAALLIRTNDASADQAVELAVGAWAPTARGSRPMAALYRRAPALYHALRPGRVYTRDEFLDGADPRLDAIASSDEAELAHLRLLRVSQTGETNAWLIVGRVHEGFRSATGSLLSALDAHLSIALGLSAVIERRRTQALVASAALNRLGLGWITIDARGRIVDQDEHSTFVRPALLQEFATGPAAEEIGVILRRAAIAPQVVRLSNLPRIDALIVPLPLDARATGEVAAVYIDAEDRPSASTRDARGDALQALFGLSRTEALLADAISRGEAIASAAARMGITEQTARNYSKRIYANTATTGQADLTRLVLTGLAGLT